LCSLSYFIAVAKMNFLSVFVLGATFVLTGVQGAFAATVLNPIANDKNNQHQINEALKKGGVVHLNAGTYVVSSTINMVSGTTLEGDRGAKIIVADNARWEKYRPIIRMLRVKNVRVTGFEIDGNRDKNLFPYDSALQAPGHQFYRIFYLYASDNIEIDHMYLHDTWDDVVFSEKVWDLNFHDNVVRRPGHDIVSIYHSGTTFVTNNCMKVYGNSGARTWGNSGPLYVISNNISKEENAPSFAGIQSTGYRSVAHDCNNTIQGVSTKYATISSGKINAGGCPISATASIATSSCNASELASTGGSSSSTGGCNKGGGSTSTDTDTDSSAGTGGASSGGSDTSSDVGQIAANMHLVGGFHAKTAEAMAAVAKIGGNVISNDTSYMWGLDKTHAKLESDGALAAKYGIKLISDVPHQLMIRYRTNWNMNQLLADAEKHFAYVAKNPSLRSKIIGYYTIGDWDTDFGKAKVALQKVAALAHKYTPEKPAICGLQANSGWSGNAANYRDRYLLNYTPEGCDMLAVYLYPWGAGKVPMTNFANVITALKSVGWTASQTPIVAVPQSYGGKYGYSVPTAAQVESQTKYFCQLGARHVVFYDFLTATNGSNSTSIQAGMKAGIKACQTIWGN
jgi:hypothetical protein